MDLLDTQIFPLIGEEGFASLVAAFYRRVPADDILGPMYNSRDLAGAEWRLREFLIGRFGGPERYIEKRGHPRLKMRHHPFTIDQGVRNRWIELMSQSMEEVKLNPQAEKVLRKFFEDSGTFLINQD
jgi:hemoglobin